MPDYHLISLERVCWVRWMWCGCAACDPNCNQCNTAGAGLCDAGQCHARYALTADKTCQGLYWWAFTSSHLISSYLISSELHWLVKATANWLTSQHTAQFAMAATSRGAFSSDDIRALCSASDDIRSDEMRRVTCERSCSRNFTKRWYCGRDEETYMSVLQKYYHPRPSLRQSQSFSDRSAGSRCSLQWAAGLSSSGVGYSLWIAT